MLLMFEHNPNHSRGYDISVLREKFCENYLYFDSKKKILNLQSLFSFFSLSTDRQS